MKTNYKLKSFTVAILLGLASVAFAQTSTFSTPGTVSWTVPASVTALNVDMQGGNGGRATGPNTGIGGNGGRVRCILTVTAGESLNIVVGGKGDTGVVGTSASGGYNNTVATGGHCISLSGYVGGGGGGASEICTGSTALSNRLVVAGAGGGGGGNQASETGGAGGGTTAGNGISYGGDFAGTGGGPAAGGLGGSYSSYGTSDPGTARYGGKASTFPTSVDGSGGGGGGGGWYGGGGGSWGAGGGGSSYTDPVRASSVIHTPGYNTTGDGSVTLTFICETPLAGTITGTSTVCAGGSTTTLTNPTGSSYGVWSSSNMAVASIDAATGAVTSGVAGTTTITFTAMTVCGTSATTTTNVTVTALPSAGTITGSNHACPGTTETLSNATTGGVWSSSSASIASVNASTGIVNCVSAGSATITYTVTISGCTGSTTFPFTVDGPAICNVGVNNVAGAASQLSISPNPGTGLFNVSLASGYNVTTRFMITNIMGEKVMGVFSETNKPITLKLDGPSGIYFLTAENVYGTWNEKIALIK